MTFHEPLVSIIIPAYNAEAYLLDTVRSVQSQTHNRLEIIIVDDGSTDDTSTVAALCAEEDFRVHVVTQLNSGPSSARNTGLRSASGEYLCFLDSDDTIHPVKIARQVDALERTGAGLAFCDYYTADQDMVPLAIHRTRPLLASVKEQLPLQNVFPVHSALFGREVFDRVGEFDESLLSAEDWDYWMRCAEVTEMVHVPGALCSYRTHETQIHNNRQRMRSSQLRVVRKNFRPGSPQRRTAMAGFHWGEAKYQYGQKHLGRTSLHLLRVFMLTRTPTRTRQVIRLGRYG